MATHHHWLFWSKRAGTVHAEPLPVCWPAGQYVIILQRRVGAVIWGRAAGGVNCYGTSAGEEIHVRFAMDEPASCFSLSGVNAYDNIISVQVDGVEQIAGPLNCAVFCDRPIVVWKPRWWWGWAVRLFDWVADWDTRRGADA